MLLVFYVAFVQVNYPTNVTQFKERIIISLLLQTMCVSYLLIVSIHSRHHVYVFVSGQWIAKPIKLEYEMIVGIQLIMIVR